MDQSSIIFKNLQHYTPEFLDTLTENQVPLEVKIENMEDNSVGFMAIFETDHRSIEFYTMNVELQSTEPTQPLLIIERK